MVYKSDEARICFLHVFVQFLVENILVYKQEGI